MSKIVGVALLMVILVDVFYHSTVCKAAPASLRVTKAHLRKCGCRIHFNEKITCRSPGFPRKPVQKQNLVKCFCSKANQHKFPEFQAACRSWQPNIPITLL